MRKVENDIFTLYSQNEMLFKIHYFQRKTFKTSIFVKYLSPIFGYNSVKLSQNHYRTPYKKGQG